MLDVIGVSPASEQNPTRRKAATRRGYYPPAGLQIRAASRANGVLVKLLGDAALET
jgi:hypothetical protein